MGIILLINVFLKLLLLECLDQVCVSAEQKSTPGGASFPPDFGIPRSPIIDFIDHPDTSVPDHFDVRDKWPNCGSLFDQIVDQGKCQMSWVPALLSTMSDRLCIQSNGTDIFQYSVEDLLTCCSTCFNAKPKNICQSGWIFRTIRHLYSKGCASGENAESSNLNSSTQSGGCKPLSEQTRNGEPPECEDKCSNPEYKTSDKRYCGRATYLYNHPGIIDTKQVQIEVMKNGPMTMFINATPSFMNYTDEIFAEETDEILGRPNFMQAVRLFGWGNENGTPYWLMANTWGRNWGRMGGLFKIAMTENVLHVEEFALAPFPSKKASAKIREVCCSVFVLSVFMMYVFK
ncbi:cathepsin B-like cysteine proteinase 4 [Zophobas morio]|uniref:cathepsin B-like cysteine proteinase 4 n=1 Tax=Zophobas morio TaxID=2755281 RepID=UPI003082C10B